MKTKVAVIIIIINVIAVVVIVEVVLHFLQNHLMVFLHIKY